MFPPSCPQRIRPWIAVLSIPACSLVGTGGLKPGTRAGPSAPGRSCSRGGPQAGAPGVPEREAPLPHRAPKRRPGKGRKEGREERGRQPPGRHTPRHTHTHTDTHTDTHTHTHTHTLEPLWQSKRPTYPVSHRQGPLIIATLAKQTSKKQIQKPLWAVH